MVIRTECILGGERRGGGHGVAVVVGDDFLVGFEATFVWLWCLVSEEKGVVLGERARKREQDRGR